MPGVFNYVAIITKLKIQLFLTIQTLQAKYNKKRYKNIFNKGGLANIPLENKNVGEVTGAMFTYPDTDKMKLRYPIILCYKNVLFAVVY